MNWGIRVLQTHALPLGYDALFVWIFTIKITLTLQALSLPENGADDEARTRYLHLGKVALYQMSYIRKQTALLLYDTYPCFVNTFFQKISFTSFSFVFRVILFFL